MCVDSELVLGPLLLFLLFRHNARSSIAQEERLATSPNR